MYELYFCRKKNQVLTSQDLLQILYFAAYLILNWSEDSETYKAKLQKEQGITPPLNLNPWIRVIRLGLVLLWVVVDIGNIIYIKVSTYVCMLIDF